MTATVFKRLAAILLMGLLPMIAVAVDQPHALFLLGHSQLENPSLTLDETDWRWLRERRTLVMGVSAPDYAPFDLSNNNDELEGITADYAALVAQALNIIIEVRRYDTRDEVIEALKQGAVDFVGSANGYEAADPELELSRSYANDQPTLVTR
ncbi:transporter substrate-binding domain-containing protein, partial [Pseudomonas veronii]